MQWLLYDEDDKLHSLHEQYLAADLLVVYCRLSKQQLSDFTTSAFICPGHQVTSLANDTSGISLLTDLSRAERSGKLRISRVAATMLGPNKPLLARIVFSPNRVAWIINLYINFPADRKRHVDMSSVSHGD